MISKESLLNIHRYSLLTASVEMFLRATWMLEYFSFLFFLFSLLSAASNRRDWSVWLGALVCHWSCINDHRLLRDITRRIFSRGFLVSWDFRIFRVTLRSIVIEYFVFTYDFCVSRFIKAIAKNATKISFFMATKNPIAGIQGGQGIVTVCSLSRRGNKILMQLQMTQ